MDLQIVDGVGPVIDRPIRTAADVEALRAFDPAEAVGPLLEAIALIRREAQVPLIGFAGAPFTLASYLVEGRGSRDALAIRRLLRDQPLVAAELFTRLTDMTVAYVRAQVAAGAQAIQLFDSWVGVLGPFDYEREVLPHMRRLFGAIGDLGVPTVHFGTGASGLLPLLAAAGGNVIGIDWRIGLDAAWRQIPDRAVQGNLDPNALLGPWEPVREQAAWVLREAGGRPGHIFNLGHGVLPGTDPDHLRRLVDLVHDETAQGRAS